jgi:hypothetical protein
MAPETGISFHTGPGREPERELIYQGLGEMDEWGCRNGAFLSEKAQCGGPLGRAPLLGILVNMLSKALIAGTFLNTGSVGEPGGDSLARTSERKG